MLNLNDASHGEIRIAEVGKKKDTIQEAIEQSTKVNKDILKEQLMKPSRLVTLSKEFIKNTKKGFKMEVKSKICDGDMDLENMQLSRLETILKDYELWKVYRDKMELHKVS